jgi:hypothetical protein
MAIDADNFTVTHDYTTGICSVGAGTHIDLPFTALPDAKAAANAGPSAWNAWINAQPLPPSVKAWHTSGLDATRREAIRLRFAAMSLP